MDAETLKADLDALVNSLRERSRSGGCGTGCQDRIADEIQRIIDKARK